MCEANVIVHEPIAKVMTIQIRDSYSSNPPADLSMAKPGLTGSSDTVLISSVRLPRPTVLTTGSDEFRVLDLTQCYTILILCHR